MRVTVDGRKGTVQVQIEDNGKGFHVEPTMIRAAKNGRLGLVGIGERVRLLGGQFDVPQPDRRADACSASICFAGCRPTE